MKEGRSLAENAEKSLLFDNTVEVYSWSQNCAVLFSKAVARRDNWGECIFIYSCPHTVKTITYKRNQSGMRYMNMNMHPHPIKRLATALLFSSHAATTDLIVDWIEQTILSKWSQNKHLLGTRKWQRTMWTTIANMNLCIEFHVSLLSFTLFFAHKFTSGYPKDACSGFIFDAKTGTLFALSSLLWDQWLRRCLRFI